MRDTRAAGYDGKPHTDLAHARAHAQGDAASGASAHLLRLGRPVFDWILNVVRTLGYPGIAFFTLLENVVPPIPSELIMPFAGFLAERGDLAFWGAVAAGTVGSVTGAVGWYVVGRRVGEERVRAFFRRHGRWVALSGNEIDMAMGRFRRHGASSVMIGRLVPAVRTFISLPAGFTGMPLVPFLLYTIIGTAVWTGALTYAGVLLGRNYQAVEGVVGPATWVVLGAIALWYLYRVIGYDARDAEAGKPGAPGSGGARP